MNTQKLAQLIDQGCKEAVEVMKKKEQVSERILKAQAQQEIFEALAQSSEAYTKHLRLNKVDGESLDSLRESLIAPFRLHTYISTKTQDAIVTTMMEPQLQSA